MPAPACAWFIFGSANCACLPISCKRQAQINTSISASGSVCAISSARYGTGKTCSFQKARKCFWSFASSFLIEKRILKNCPSKSSPFAPYRAANRNRTGDLNTTNVAHYRLCYSSLYPVLYRRLVCTSPDYRKLLYHI